MPRRRTDGEIPLPEGWETCIDADGKAFYLDHHNQRTTWIDPRDRLTKPETFADCVGDELPYGWEVSWDPQVGTYYINHLIQRNQVEDPRLQWRQQQDQMLKEYLTVANKDLQAKKEIYTVKKHRLAIAEEEVQHLNDALANWRASHTSINSTSSVATKYDPDLVRSEVALARDRVARLRHELAQIEAEVRYKERGVDTLARVDQKMGDNNYTVGEAQDILNRIRFIRKSLRVGEREKHDLMAHLFSMRDEYLMAKVGSESSPDISTLSIPKEKLSTASQTDLSGETNYNNQWAEMVRLRLRYDEACQQVTKLQEQLASIEDQIIPGQNESDKDRLLLIKEKEQYLRELRSINPKGRSAEEMDEINQKIASLEQDLVRAMEYSNKKIADRLRLNEQKSVILNQLAEATRLTTYLESQLKSLSVSTLSISSGSSRGSMGSLSASSKSSLNSLSFTDIYMSGIYNQSDSSLADLHKRVEQLLNGHSIATVAETPSNTNVPMEHSSSVESLPGWQQSALPQMSYKSLESSQISFSPPQSPYFDVGPPPSYEQHIERQQVHEPFAALQARLSQLSITEEEPIEQQTTVVTPVTSPSSSSPSLNFTPAPIALLSHPNQPYSEVEQHLYAPENVSTDNILGNPPLSPISESSSGVCNNLSGVNTRSVSAAVSDESVAGDSGVFEASHKLDALEMAFETAQIQIKLQYLDAEGKLLIGFVEARNLTALDFPDENTTVHIKAALLPSPPEAVFCSKSLSNVRDPTFHEIFDVTLPVSKLTYKTLQVHVFCAHNRREECVGCAQVSLSAFDPKLTSCMWYNVLSFRFMHTDAVSGQNANTNTAPSSDKVTQLLEASSARLRRSSFNSAEKQSSPDTAKDLRLRSFSDSTYSRAYISSVKEESSDESTIISSQTSTLTRNQGPEQDEEDLEEEEVVSSDEDDGDDTNGCSTNSQGEANLHEEEIDEDKLLPLLIDKETNTELKKKQSAMDEVVSPARGSSIRRSQTFSPAGRPSHVDYICRLNRSGSDSSLKYRRGAFQRNTLERKSIRMKGGLHLSSRDVGKSASASVTKRPSIRTSLDLELDLQASEVQLLHMQDELVRLRQIKRHFEDAKAKGGQEFPEYLAEEQIQQFFKEAEKLQLRIAGNRNIVDELTERNLRKMRKHTKEIHKLRRSHTDQPDAVTFREKMAFFTKVRMKVPVLIPKPEGEAMYIPRNPSSSSLVEESPQAISEESPQTVSKENVQIVHETLSEKADEVINNAVNANEIVKVVIADEVVNAGNKMADVPIGVSQETAELIVVGEPQVTLNQQEQTEGTIPRGALLNFPENVAKPKPGPIASANDNLLTLEELEELGDGVVPVTEL